MKLKKRLKNLRSSKKTKNRTFGSKINKINNTERTTDGSNEPRKAKIIIVTGTPGTGKTFISRKMAKFLVYSHIEISKFIRQRRLYEGIDRRRKSHIVDEKKLAEALRREFKRQLAKSSSQKPLGFIVDGHMSHFLSPSLVDYAICCKSPLKTIKSRLEKRNYSKSKIRENLDSEIFDICYNEALEIGHKPIIFDGSGLKSLLLRLK